MSRPNLPALAFRGAALRRAIWLGAFASVAAFGQAQAPAEYGDPEIEKPPTKAYHEAIRVRGVGVKVGEVTSSAAIVWARVPPISERRFDSKRDVVTWLKSLFVEEDNQIRMRYGRSADLAGAPWTRWVDTDDGNDYCHQWVLRNLQPGAATATADARD